MTKQKILFFAFMALGAIKVSAQQNSVTAGGDATGAGGSVAYSVGQIVYTYSAGTTGSVNQGVQQPYELLSVGVSNHTDISLYMSVYPNPSVSLLNLNVGKQDLQDLTLQLFDLQGKLLYAQKISNSETAIKMEEYDAGNYFLKIFNSKEELKTFTIIKN